MVYNFVLGEVGIRNVAHLKTWRLVHDAIGAIRLSGM